MDGEQLNFEEALKELEIIVKKLEDGNISLEQAMRSYERGAFLKSYCDSLLEEARLKIDQIMIKETGDLETRPFDSRSP